LADKNTVKKLYTVNMPKLSPPLTDERISVLTPRSNSYLIGDGRGLFLVIDPTGKKHWRMRYGKGRRRETSIAFGHYPDVSLAEARDMRDEALQLIAKGIDPVETKREQMKRDREARPAPPPKLRFSMNAGALVIENTTGRMTLAAAQVIALRTFLAATNESIEGE
jgi:hypothetical protein